MLGITTIACRFAAAPINYALSRCLIVYEYFFLFRISVIPLRRGSKVIDIVETGRIRIASLAVKRVGDTNTHPPQRIIMYNNDNTLLSERSKCRKRATRRRGSRSIDFTLRFVPNTVTALRLFVSRRIGCAKTVVFAAEVSRAEARQEAGARSASSSLFTDNDSHDDDDETLPRRRPATTGDAGTHVNSCVSRPRGRPLYVRNEVPHSRPTARGHLSASSSCLSSSCLICVPREMPPSSSRPVLCAPLARYRSLNLPDLIGMPDSARITADRFSTARLWRGESWD